MPKDPAAETIGFIRFYPRGSLAEAAIAEAPDARFGPESDWIDALLRIPGEFSPLTWSRIADAYGPTFRPGAPPREALALGVGGVFRRRYHLAQAAIRESIAADLSSASEPERAAVESILAAIAWEMLARTYLREPTANSIARLQQAMDAVAGGPTRSVTEMLETDASFASAMRSRQRQREG